jgi:bifunctional non-homologous end joining protein LigD
MTQMHSRGPDESQFMFLALDLLHQDGADLRSETLSQRKRALDRLCRGAPVPYFHQVEVFAGGEVQFDYCKHLGFGGVVSKRRQSGYASGSSRWWVKVKCPELKRANSKRWRLLEKPEPT